MMGNEFQQQRLGRRPRQRAARGCQRPGLQIGEIRGEGAQSVFAHAFVDEVSKRFDILIGQKLGEFVAPFQRQHSGDGVEFFRAAIDGVHFGRPCSS